MSPQPQPTTETHPHVCSMCAQPSPRTICETCEAKVRGELLHDKMAREKAGHTDTNRH